MYGGSSAVYSAFISYICRMMVASAGLSVPEWLYRRWLSKNLGMFLCRHDPRIARVRREMGTWKTRRLRQKERTPLGNTIFEWEGWTETTIACEEFYFAQPLKLWNSSQRKKWKKTHQRTDGSFMNRSGSSRISAKIKLHPCMNHITFYHKSFPF